MRRNTKIAVLAIVAAVLVVCTGLFLGLYTEVVEIREIGSEYTKVFFKDIFAKIEAFGVIFAVIFAACSINLLFVRKNAARITGQAPRFMKRKFLFLASALLALVGAGTFSEEMYRKLLMFSNSAEANTADPIFNLDLSYYFFNRAFLQSAASALISILVFALMMNLILYFYILAHGQGERVRETLTDNGVFIHLAVNAIILVVAVGFTYYFRAQGLLLDQTHTFAGASYTDVNIILPFYTMAPYLLFAIAIAASVFLF